VWAAFYAGRGVVSNHLFRVIHSDAMCAGCRHRINPAASRLENPLAGYVGAFNPRQRVF